MTIRLSLKGMELWSSFHFSGAYVELVDCTIMLLLLLFIVDIILKVCHLFCWLAGRMSPLMVSLKYYHINF